MVTFLIMMGLLALLASVGMSIARLFAKKGTWGKVGLVALGGLVAMIVGASMDSHPGVKSSSTPQHQPQVGAVTPKKAEPYTKAQAVAKSPATIEQPDWNVDDVDSTSNGNMEKAAEYLKQLPEAKVRQAAVAVDADQVAKAPWKYYGRLLRFRGDVVDLVEYPPSSDEAELLGGKASQFVLSTSATTPVDGFYMGDSGLINKGNQAELYGVPVGTQEVPNQLGGKTTQLILVCRSVRKL